MMSMQLRGAERPLVSGVYATIYDTIHAAMCVVMRVVTRALTCVACVMLSQTKPNKR
jgi:hypothetical protein